VSKIRLFVSATKRKNKKTLEVRKDPINQSSAKMRKMEFNQSIFEDWPAEGSQIPTDDALRAFKDNRYL